MIDGILRGRWRGLVLLCTLVIITALVAQSATPASTFARKERHAAAQKGAAARHDGKKQPNRRGDVQAQIVGGDSVKQGKLSFMTLVLIDIGDDEGFIQCGGSLIAPSYVLTAAHCVEDDDGDLFPAGDFLLIVGRSTVSQAGSANVRGVSQVVQDPDWNSITFANDAAVLQLDEPVPESIARPLDLVERGNATFNNAGRSVTVAGWGRTCESDKCDTTNTLREATVKITSDSECVEDYNGGIDPEVMICAAAKGKDSCFGDSGGPLIAQEVIGSRKVKKKSKRHKVTVPIHRDVQIGIVSSGLGCAEPEFPGVYTRLSNPDINDFVTSALNS